jgi:predicted metal-binding protein
MTEVISICQTCAPVDSVEMVARLAALVGPGAAVRLGPCLNQCAKPVAISFRATGKTAYLFAGVDPARQVAEIATFAQMYAASLDGEIADARPCGDLRFCLIGRIPA